MAVTHATAVRQDFYNIKTGQAAASFSAGASQKLIIYSGTPPANAAASLSSNTAIATITALVWGAPTAGVGNITGSSADTNAVGGTATFYRITKSDGTTAIEQGTVGTGGTDLIISSTVIAAGANVSLTGTNSYTASP